MTVLIVYCLPFIANKSLMIAEQTLKGYCYDNFATFSSKLCLNYDPEPCSKQELTLLQPQEEDIKEFFRGKQTSFFFSGDISHSQ